VSFDDRTPAELLTTIEQNNALMLQQIKEMPELHSAVQLALLCDFLQDSTKAGEIVRVCEGCTRHL
jgi:hypothetical protein